MAFVAVKPANANGQEKSCGGAILSENFILTAGSCFGKSTSLFYFLWNHCLSLSDGSLETIRLVETVTIKVK